MNTVRIGVITVWAAVGASGYLSLRDAARDEPPSAQAIHAQSPQATRAQSTNRTANNRTIDRRAEQALAEHPLAEHSLDSVTDPAPGPDASDVTQPLRTQNQVFDVLNADIGPEGEYADPDALATMLRSDPELGRLLNE
jgi:hypothetical protein